VAVPQFESHGVGEGGSPVAAGRYEKSVEVFEEPSERVEDNMVSDRVHSQLKDS
jgi:hypothetical protein